MDLVSALSTVVFNPRRYLIFNAGVILELFQNGPILICFVKCSKAIFLLIALLFEKNIFVQTLVFKLLLQKLIKSWRIVHTLMLRYCFFSTFFSNNCPSAHPLIYSFFHRAYCYIFLTSWFCHECWLQYFFNPVQRY